VTYALGASKIHDDAQSKVMKWSAGLITAAGLVQLIDAVNSRLEQEQVIDTNDILAAIKEERDELRANGALVASKQEIEGFIQETGWILSYVTQQEGEPVMRLGVLHPQLELETNGELALYVPGEVAMIMPVEASESEATRYHELLKSLLKPIEEIENTDAHYSYHRLLCGAIVEQAASQFESVSTAMQLGVHTITGQIDTTDLITVPEARSQA